MMKAAVVNDFKQEPQIQQFKLPVPSSNESLVKVLAASVNQVVRARANGSHYSSATKLPLIPGVDGVGTLLNGQLGYFLASNPVYGSLAEQTVVDQRRVIPLSQDTDPAKVAAAMNPAMSSWMAITSRIAGGVRDKKVLIIGATGNAGQLAIQISKYLGAKQVIAVGRNREQLAKLPALGADQTICLLDSVEQLTTELATAVDTDVVLDYLWGSVTQQLLPLILKNRLDKQQLLTWVQIGSIAGATFEFPSAALRSGNLTLIGSGIGSVSPQAYLQELPKLAALISTGKFTVNYQAVPLADLTAANWAQNSPRVVYTMN